MTIARLDDAGGPRLNRSLRVALRGDFGLANLHRVCGWLSAAIISRSGAYTRTSITNGSGMFDNIDAVAAGEVDIAVVTPAAAASLAMRRAGPFTTRPYDHLRAVACLPHDDRLVIAVDRRLAVATASELAEVKELRLGTGSAAWSDAVGWAARELLGRSGCDLGQWEVVGFDQPFGCVDALRHGLVDAIVHEAVMTPPWQELGASGRARFLSADQHALDSMAEDLGWKSGTLPPGYFPHSDAELVTLDFSGYLIVVREDLDPEVADLLAWCVSERIGQLEAGFRHIPADKSPLRWPIDRAASFRTTIPLHEAVAHSEWYLASEPDPSASR